MGSVNEGIEGEVITIDAPYLENMSDILFDNLQRVMNPAISPEDEPRRGLVEINHTMMPAAAA